MFGLGHWEIILILVIVLIVSAMAYPNFSSWRTDREVRMAAEKVASMITGIITQTQRGSFPYVQFSVNITSGVTNKLFLTKGMSQKTLSNTKNAGNTVNCDIVNAGVWDNHKVHSAEAEVAVHTATSGSVCFSKDAGHYGLNGSFPSNYNINLSGRLTANYIILCDLLQMDYSVDPPVSRIGANGQCDISQLQKPAYLVEWTRFGGITLYKWSGDASNGWSIL